MADVGTDPRAAVDLRDVTAGYGDGPAVLDGLDLRFGAGLTSLVGPNGSGKSTILELASGYLRPRRGAVRIHGDAAHLPSTRARRRVCRSAPALYPHVSVRDHLVLASACAGVDPGPALERMEAFGMAAWADHQVGQLSTGNVRKLWFVFCTVGSFDVLLLDEPFQGVDAESRALQCAEITTWADHGAVVLVSHQHPEDLRTPDHVVHVHGRPSGATGRLHERARP